MVYRPPPPPSHAPSNYGHKQRNETSVVFIKTEPGTEQLKFSLLQPCPTTKASQNAHPTTLKPPPTMTLVQNTPLNTMTLTKKAPPTMTSVQRTSLKEKACPRETPPITTSEGSRSNSHWNAEDRTNVRSSLNVTIKQEPGVRNVTIEQETGAPLTPTDWGRTNVRPALNVTIKQKRGVQNVTKTPTDWDGKTKAASSKKRNRRFRKRLMQGKVKM